MSDSYSPNKPLNDALDSVNTNIGKPKMRRIMKSTELFGGRRVIEIQYQICMVVPSRSFKTKQNAEMVFEDMISQRVREIQLDGLKLELMGIAAGFTAQSCSGVMCDNYKDECLTCKGLLDLAELEITAMEGIEIIQTERCFKDKEALDRVTECCVKVLRNAICGRSKFPEKAWRSICEHVTEARAGEILDGVELTMKHVIYKSNRNQISHRAALNHYFISKLGDMINNMGSLTLNETQVADINDLLSIYDPAKKMDKGYINGRLEIRDVAGFNLQIVSLGGYFAIRQGTIDPKFNGDSKLQARCSKINEIHSMAAIGKAILPGGIVRTKHETILPIAPSDFNQTPEDNRKTIEPVSIVLIL